MRFREVMKDETKVGSYEVRKREFENKEEERRERKQRKKEEEGRRRDEGGIRGKEVRMMMIRG